MGTGGFHGFGGGGWKMILTATAAMIAKMMSTSRQAVILSVTMRRVKSFMILGRGGGHSGVCGATEKLATFDCTHYTQMI